MHENKVINAQNMGPELWLIHEASLGSQKMPFLKAAFV